MRKDEGSPEKHVLIDEVQRLRTYPTESELVLLKEVIEIIEDHYK